MDTDAGDFDYYDILNVPRDSSVDDIKASYHRLIRQWHPDKNFMPVSDPSQPLSVTDRTADAYEIPQELQRDSAFTKIQLAYSVLSDPARRRVYDKYGSEGVQLKMLLQKQLDSERVESRTIPESLEDEATLQKSWELRRAADEVEIERRIHVLLQKRRWDKFRDFPVQVVSHCTFGGVTNFFDDQIATVMRRRMFQIRETCITNSVEVLLSRHTRAGYTYYSSATRGTFGKCRGGVRLSSELTDTVESTVSVEWGDYLSYRSTALSIKKMFSENFWATSIFALDRYLTPAMRCVVHKSWGEHHAVELTALPDYAMTYGYNRTFAGDLKSNLQIAASQDDLGALVRVKARSGTGSVIGTICRFSVLGGLFVEGYVRHRFDTELLARLKLECRLRYSRSSLFVIFKIVLNNNRIDLPIELYSGSVDHCIFLGTAASCLLMLLPAVAEVAMKLVSPAEPEPCYGLEGPSLRRSFYSQFPAFSYFGLCGVDARYHERYVSDSSRQGPLLSRALQWSEEGLEAIVVRELHLARQEGAALRNSAVAAYQRELESDGLCVLFAVYGHPEALRTLVEFVTMDLFENLGGITDSADSPAPRSQPIGSARRFVFGSVTVTSILKQNDQMRLQRLFDRYLLEVTNVLMSRVTDSRLQLSVNTKGQLIGFADPCANLPKVEPKLYVCYRYKKRVYAATFGDGDPVRLPDGCEAA
ncbi:DnaJ domain containing protein, putative [Babesia bigemina]|uniref:DnaJ domain containing protein, putative n=1 Tax=Babesia bigemina TaxID=5866 RepID=A0A061DC36_BABBI|nr:DnaJ domain containing protein, putative [Babesia bigemina]CDR96494.1 DnaJ domain containing protein, putative [Babesia bigemina]|eukprot:XP_012768680.1 DnaJ domain containing protein, putative [Babesia bigemina]